MTRADYVIVFDGGSIGNPGTGYGSYALIGSDGTKRIERLRFAGRVTNNEAEYDTLVASLEDLLSMIRQTGCRPTEFSVEVRGDSQLVIYQVTGRWKARDERMRQRRDRVIALARQFKHVAFVQHPREESVRVLGH